MNIFISSLLIIVLGQGVVHAVEPLQLIKIPSHITTEQAILDLRQAAVYRKWTVLEAQGENLRISLDHRGYKSILEFFVSDRTIKYTDFTTIRVRKKQKPISAPTKWIRNIKKGTQNLFYKRTNGSASSVQEHNVMYTLEEVEKHLDGLKKLYEKKLITEEEYKLKKSEILSKY